MPKGYKRQPEDIRMAKAVMIGAKVNNMVLYYNSKSERNLHESVLTQTNDGIHMQMGGKGHISLRKNSK